MEERESRGRYLARVNMDSKVCAGEGRESGWDWEGDEKKYPRQVTSCHTH